MHDTYLLTYFIFVLIIAGDVYWQWLQLAVSLCSKEYDDDYDDVAVHFYQQYVCYDLIKTYCCYIVCLASPTTPEPGILRNLPLRHILPCS